MFDNECHNDTLVYLNDQRLHWLQILSSMSETRALKKQEEADTYLDVTQFWPSSGPILAQNRSPVSCSLRPLRLPSSGSLLIRLCALITGCRSSKQQFSDNHNNDDYKCCHRDALLQSP